MQFPLFIRQEVKAVLFDVDNTLIASDKFIREYIIKTVLRLNENGLGLNLPLEEAIIHVQAKNLSFEDIFKELFIGEYNGRFLWEIVLENYREYAPNDVYEPTIGALDAIRKLLKNDIIVGLVTNRVRMLSERLVQAGFSVDEFFCICQPPSVEFRKPHPRAFEEALKLLRVRGIYPEDVIMFGDHLDDYYSATYQNIKFVGVFQGQTSRTDFLHAEIENELIVDDLNNIEEILKKVIDVCQYKSSLSATSALDGRHRVMTFPLRHYFSEYALHKYRIKTEIEHVIALSEYFDGKIVRLFSDSEKVFLRKLYQEFSEHDAYEVLQYDHLSRKGIGPTEHDVKSCEIWIKEKLVGTSLEDIASAIHIFVTSEDINNFAYKMMLAEGVNNVFVPSVYKLTERLKELALEYADDPIMGRTHIQPASPTTFGKIFAIFLSRLTDGLRSLYEVKLTGKINGAVGNYNSFVSAYPELDWLGYSKELSLRLGFEVELYTDQRGTHVDMIRAFQAVQEIGGVIRDIATDLSLYSAFGTMYFSKVDTHVGSSVMPHKVNPWFAEVAEGNIKKANYIINSFSNELDISRLQRDLSDHDYERSYGEALGYVFVALKHLHIAMDLIRVDKEFAKEELSRHPEIVTEAIQTILRKYGRVDAYNLLKSAFRGKNIKIDDLKNYIMKLDVSENIRQEISNVADPQKYIGMASVLTKNAVEKYIKFRTLVKSDYLYKK